MRLYHFTAPTDSHLGSILDCGYIDVTESNCSRDVAHAGPDVVWLTTLSDPSAEDIAVRVAQSGLPPDIKRLARITVEIDDAELWAAFAQRHGVPRPWRRTLERGRKADTWYVAERRVDGAEWIAVEVWTGQVWETAAVAVDDDDELR
jgi:hypothetical protein